MLKTVFLTPTLHKKKVLSMTLSLNKEKFRELDWHVVKKMTKKKKKKSTFHQHFSNFSLAWGNIVVFANIKTPIKMIQSSDPTMKNRCGKDTVYRFG